MKAELLEALLAARQQGTAVVLATNVQTGEQILLDGPSRADVPAAIRDAARAALAEDRGRTVETPQGPVFVEPFNPPLRCLIVGAVHIAQPLSAMATLAGYAVTVIDPRSAFATAQRFPGVELSHDWPDEALAALKPDGRTAVVTLTHDPKLDDPALIAALASPAFYIGALGSKKTHGARGQRLVAQGVPESALERIHGPVGLAIGAVSPGEIAVAILAQMTAVLRAARTAAREAA